jgi:hypothetical protein
MTSKERILLFGILLITMLLLPLTLKATTEDEMVQQFLNKHQEVTKRQMMIAPFFALSYGKVKPTGYNDFTTDVNTMYARAVNTTDATALASVHRITSFEGGVSLLINRGQLSFGLEYWLTVGSNKQGDFQLTNFSTGMLESKTDFEMRSQIKVWGVYLDYQYFVYNKPIPNAIPAGLSARVGGGVGFYGAAWRLWDGFGGEIQDTGEWYELTDNLKGSGAGFHISAGIEYPAFKGIVLAADAKYLWLKFDKLSKRLTPTYELYLVNSDTKEPIDIDFTGPRLNLSIKHYFTL